MNRSLRVLHLEDDPYDAELIRETLNSEGTTHTIINADDQDSFLAALEHEKFDIIIADFALPSFNGQAALNIAQQKCPDIPFIFVSGAIGEERAIASLKQGATDYVLKHRLSGLIPAVQRALREVAERRERQQAINTLAIRARQQAAVATLGQLALLNTPLPQLMDEAVTLMVQALDVQYGQLLQLLPGGQALQMVAGFGWRDAVIGQAIIEADLASQAGYTLLSQEPVVMTNLSTETRFRASAIAQEHQVVSGMSVVVPGEESPFGVVGVFTDQPRDFTEDDIYFLQNIAHVLATAIERKKREEELRQSRNQLRAILEGITEGITVQRPDGTLIYANEMAAQISGYPTAQALLDAPIQEISQKFELRNEAGELIPTEQLPGRKALQHGQPSSDVLIRFRPRHEGEEWWSVVSATPIFDAQGEIQFAVNIFRDVTERIRLYEAEQHARQLAEEAAERTAGLQRVTAALSQALTPSQVAQLVVEQGVAVLGADAGSVVLYREKEQMLELLYAGGYPQNVIQQWQRFPVTTPVPIAEVIRTGQAIFLESPDDALEQYPLMESGLRQTENQAWASIPLWVEGRNIGVMGLSFVEPQVFNENDQTFMLALGRQCAQALERARLYEAERTARAEAELARHRLEFLAEASGILATSLDYYWTLDKVAHLSVPRVADWCVILLTKLGGANSALETVSIVHKDRERVSWATQLLDQFALRPDFSLGLNNVLDTGQSELYIDFPTLLLGQVDSDLNREIVQRSGAQSLMIVPLKARDHIMGAMILATAESGRYLEQDDLSLAEDLARRAALAIDNARLYWEATQLNDILEQRVIERTEQLRRLTQQLVTTQEEERRRLSRELHDEAGQALTALRISLGLIQDDLPNELVTLKQRMAEAVALTREAMDQIRNLAHDLRPPSLDTVGLNLTLEGFCREFAQRTQLAITYTGTELPELPELVSTTFYRLLQEALTNVVRHAQAHRVQVILGYEDHQLSLTVSDDGQGFNTEKVNVYLIKGIGLLGMQERVELLNGQLEIDSKSGHGTRLVARVLLSH